MSKSHLYALVYEQVDATAGRFGTVVFSTVKGAKIKEVNTHVRNVMARKYQFAPSDDKVFTLIAWRNR